jgi:hypothetical protein
MNSLHLDLQYDHIIVIFVAIVVVLDFQMVCSPQLLFIFITIAAVGTNRRYMWNTITPSAGKDSRRAETMLAVSWNSRDRHPSSFEALIN